ncbi:MAG: biotin transporter BioY [bacterium]
MEKTDSIHKIVQIAFFAALTVVLAFISIPLPFSPVPITGQTLGVMLAGYLLKGKDAFLSQLIYVLMGVIGLPVFAGGSSGPGVLFGPGGGFIWGFLLAAYFIGKFTQKNKTSHKDILVLIIGGILLIYLLGAIQMILVLDLSFREVFFSSILPYLPGDFLKIFITFTVGRRIKKSRMF